MTDSLIGSTIAGKYVVHSVIGEGGMSIIYRAVQQGVDRTVAIKVLRSELSSRTHAKRMEREARSISELNHPNLVSIFDTGHLENGQPYHVLEYLDGLSLSDLIDREGPLSSSRCIPIFIQICDVMQYAHDHGLIDRDISPNNIILIKAAGMDDFVKLVDFGVMKYDEERHFVSQRLTATGEVCGNPMYMSPEQACAEELDWRTDIYSLGVVMWETVTGKHLFSGTNIAEIVTKHLYTKPPKPSLLQANVPASLEEIILRTLQKNREERYQSMHELKSALSLVMRKSRTQDSSLPAYYGKNVKSASTVAQSSAGAARAVRQAQQQNSNEWEDSRQRVATSDSSSANAEINTEHSMIRTSSTNTVRDLALAFFVSICAAACICFLMVRFISLR